jgi:hypothetical protein
MRILKSVLSSLLILGLFAVVACGTDSASSTEGSETEMQEAPATEQSTEDQPAEGEHPEGSEHPSDGEHPEGSEHPSN